MHMCGQLYTGTNCETNTNNDLCVNPTSVGMAIMSDVANLNK